VATYATPPSGWPAASSACSPGSRRRWAFLVSEEEFDAAFARIQDAGVTFYADPGCRQPGQIYRSRGRRGTYFRDPNGHLMEILTPAA
jgi:catechol 2,3-dioxygenase-like lactoylglutathione lyase family enzyme